MSIRRTALDALTRPRLREIALRAGIEVYTSASRNEMLDSISRSHSIPFKDLLAEFLRDELKLACQRLGLEEAGRSRRELIKRVIAADRQLRKEKAESKAAARAKVRTVRMSHSRGTSNLMNGVAQMEEPKVVPNPDYS